MTSRLLITVVAAVLMAGAGCGGQVASDSESYEANIARCHSWCAAYAAEGCTFYFHIPVSADSCRHAICRVFDSGVPTGCKGAWVAYLDCLASQPDVCAGGDRCQPELEARESACR